MLRPLHEGHSGLDPAAQAWPDQRQEIPQDSAGGLQFTPRAPCVVRVCPYPQCSPPQPCFHCYSSRVLGGGRERARLLPGEK